MKLFKKFTPNVAVYRNMTINSAFENFKNSKGLSLGFITGKFFEFSGYGSGIHTEYAYLYSIQTYKRGKKYKYHKEVHITYYVIPMKLIEILNLKVIQKKRHFIIQ
ncbi:hypothetical protein DAC20_138 [Bacteroides phage DAC20]|nr:hypothetical protein DAC19_139 [Bacteroides phage DAC19]QIG63891.1 hypothetical protein DAC20_138 [Bacteroides phage DAC20]QIG64154.1 hypothetical protein DAC22_140 [Bacteroides phage DAC22]QIG64411.1 hypothetical protein DAC23_133 [Bacteroides phage DAC23]